MRPLRFLPLLLLTINAYAALPYPPEREKWLTINAGEFRIYSNASEREAKQVATSLLRMREAVGKITQLKVRSANPVDVYLFREGRFAPYRDAILQRRNASASGAFLSAGRAKFIIMEGQLDDEMERLIYHELTHFFVENTLSGLPLWFNEGIAEYYSTFSARGDDVNIGQLIPGHVTWLRSETLIPLPKLFAMDVRSPEYGEGRRQGVFYAQSWAIVHYLLIGNEQRREQLARFLGLLALGRSTEDAFKTAFNTTYADFENELRGYTRRMTMPYMRYSLSELPVPEPSPARPLSRAETLNVLGNLLAHANASTLGDAEAFLAEAIRIDPNLPAAHATLGLIHDERGDRVAAAASFEKAVALGTSDPEIYIKYGSGLIGSKGAASAKEIARARQLFERAAQLDPTSARAFAGIGATYVGTPGDVAPGIAALEKSLNLAPAQEDAAFNLVQLYARVGRRDDAYRLVDTLLSRSKDPEMARQAREAILSADMNHAQDLFDAGKTEEATAILRNVAATTTNERMRTHAQRYIAESERVQLHNKHVAGVNSAIEKAQVGQLNDAVKILDELLPKMAEGDLKIRVQKLRDDMAASRKK